ncbi:MAG: HD domain-containing protein [Candidatus Accumulibacter sp.]|jgi:HD-GYP domain-containing protein (c-di-GMP phosphodiesterase class II)|nr:HD domain-containing protein [Accumulibacter sp.]
MQARLDTLCRVISQALDVVEAEVFGSTERHSLRVAALCAAMGRRLGYDDDHLMALAIGAMFHDCALTEYVLSERNGVQGGKNLRLHCEKGQHNIRYLPLKHKPEGYILYHHEYGDGSGTFGLKMGEYPIEAELIALADRADVSSRLQSLPVEDVVRVRERAESLRGIHYSSTSIDAFLAIFDEDMLPSLRDHAIDATLDAAIPRLHVDLADPAIIHIADFVARIIDYKSVFTKQHTNQIAYRTYLMCDHYGYDDTQKGLMYLAAGLHDLGKIRTPTSILEKPGRLDPDEFDVIREHVLHTHDWLRGVPGFDDICRWASNHHEKLDGSGYPFGLCAADLDFNSRLLGCMDIYQAVSEERPYHPRRSHEEAMEIMYDMAKEGKIDSEITRDIDLIMKPWSQKDVPAPAAVNFASSDF